MFGDEATRMATLCTSYAGYSGLAIVSTEVRPTSSEVTVSDMMYVASFYITLTQLFDILIISLFNRNLIPNYGAEKTLIDDYIFNISMVIQA